MTSIEDESRDSAPGVQDSTTTPVPHRGGNANATGESVPSTRMALDFGMVALVSTQRNGATRNGLSLNENTGIVSVVQAYKKFTSDGAKELVTGTKLLETLENKDTTSKLKLDPFGKKGANCGDLLFVCFYWDCLLKAQYLEDNSPSEKLKAYLYEGFLPVSLSDYHVEGETRFDVCESFIRWCNVPPETRKGKAQKKAANGKQKKPAVTNLEKWASSDWHEVPGILRVLAPVFVTLKLTDYNMLRPFLTNTMKTLPQSVIMMPFYNFEMAKNIPALNRDPNLVS